MGESTLKAVFYDRKNKREVTSEELHPTRYVQSIAVGDRDDAMQPTGRKINPLTLEPFTREQFDQALLTEYFKDSGDPNPEWPSWSAEKTPTVLYLLEELIADLCYKSEKCPQHQNWDLHTTLSDLVFLRLG